MTEDPFERGYKSGKEERASEEEARLLRRQRELQTAKLFGRLLGKKFLGPGYSATSPEIAEKIFRERGFLFPGGFTVKVNKAGNDEEYDFKIVPSSSGESYDVTVNFPGRGIYSEPKCSEERALELAGEFYGQTKDEVEKDIAKQTNSKMNLNKKSSLKFGVLVIMFLLFIIILLAAISEWGE